MSKKVVLVTGSSRGIGLACADRLHNSDWTVIGASRRSTSGAKWQEITTNVDDDVSVHDVVAAVIAEHGRIDAVVTCAGWGLAGAAEHTSIDEAKAQLTKRKRNWKPTSGERFALFTLSSQSFEIKRADES